MAQIKHHLANIRRQQMLFKQFAEFGHIGQQKISRKRNTVTLVCDSAFSSNMAVFPP